MLINIQNQAIELQAKLFRGFGDPARLSILAAIQNGPLTVTEIVAASGLSQPNASNHLRCLRDCGLVKCEQDGRYARYALSDDRVRQLIVLSNELLADVARGVYECTRYESAEEKAR